MLLGWSRCGRIVKKSSRKDVPQKFPNVCLQTYLFWPKEPLIKIQKSFYIWYFNWKSLRIGMSNSIGFCPIFRRNRFQTINGFWGAVGPQNHDLNQLSQTVEHRNLYRTGNKTKQKITRYTVLLFRVPAVHNTHKRSRTDHPRPGSAHHALSVPQNLILFR